MKNKELQPSVPFWEPRRNDDGSTVIWYRVIPS